MKLKWNILVLLGITMLIVAPAAAQPITPFRISDWVNGSSGEHVNYPDVVIINAGAEFVVETNVSSNYYQAMTCLYNVSAGDMLSFSVNGGTATNHEVTEGGVDAGGFGQNLTAPIPGDVNGDGYLTSADAAIVLQMAVRGEYSEVADVSGDRRVASLDALMILLGNENPFTTKTIYVDGDFTDDPANHRWNTIQEGLNDANAGDTVFVYNGTYFENVTVSKSITLKGENRSNTIINCRDIIGHQTKPVIKVVSNNCTISGFTIMNGSLGILMEAANNNTITDNCVKYNKYIYLPQYSCIGCDQGICLRDSKNNIIANNDVSYNKGDGLLLGCSSSHNTIANNIIVNNKDNGITTRPAIVATPGPPFAFSNIITNNTISLNHNNGICLYKSPNNTIINNSIFNNWDNGINLELSSNNTIYHNNFINNTEQVYDNGTNFWDNGYPSGGNHWSDHECTGNPSNGSQPHTISDGAQDHYPFEDPWGWLK